MKTRLALGLLAAWAGIAVVLYLPGAERPGSVAREAWLWGFGPLFLSASAFLQPAVRRRGPAIAVGGLLLLLAAAAWVAPAAERVGVVRDSLLLLVPLVAGIVVAGRTSEADGEVFDRYLETAGIAALVWLTLSAALQGLAGLPLFSEARPPSAGYMNRNVLAQVLVPMLPLALSAAWCARGRLAATCASLAGGGALGLLIATRARGAWIAALVMLAVAGLLLWRRWRVVEVRRAARTSLVVVTSALLLAGAFGSRDRGRLPTVAQRLASFADPLPGSGEIRLAIWANTARMSLDHPGLGVGSGRFPAEYPRYASAVRRTPRFGMDQQPLRTHQDFLQWAAELGIPAGLLLAALLGGGVVGNLRHALAHPGSASGTRAALRSVALVGVAAHACFSFPLHSPVPALLAWLLAGRGWALAGSSLERERGRFAGAAVLATLAAFSLPAALGEVRASRLLLQGIEAHQRSDCKTALARSVAVTNAAGWLRRERGMAAMLRFHCDDDAERSLRWLEPALARHPHQLNLLAAAGARYIKTGQSAKATELFEHALEIAPDSQRLWLGRAMAAFAAGDAQRTGEACARVIEIDPDWTAGVTFCNGTRD